MTSRKRNRLALPRGASLLCLCLAAAGAGCAVGGSSNPFDESSRQETVVIRAENHNLHDATVYLRRGGRRQELGSVGARGFQFFEFPWPIGAPLDVEIELSVGERYRLPPFPLRGGRLELTISSTLRRSTIRG
ncbi:hypothetical protein ACFL3S_08350 [Gemmatimonadota bacterium]